MNRCWGHELLSALATRARKRDACGCPYGSPSGKPLPSLRMLTALLHRAHRIPGVRVLGTCAAVSCTLATPTGTQHFLAALRELRDSRALAQSPAYEDICSRIQMAWSASQKAERIEQKLFNPSALQAGCLKMDMAQPIYSKGRLWRLHSGYD